MFEEKVRSIGKYICNFLLDFNEVEPVTETSCKAQPNSGIRELA